MAIPQPIDFPGTDQPAFDSVPLKHLDEADGVIQTVPEHSTRNLGHRHHSPLLIRARFT